MILRIILDKLADMLTKMGMSDTVYIDRSGNQISRPKMSKDKK